MNNLLDKFDQIEVKADTRISQKDKDYCIAYHQAYVKGRAALKSLRDSVEGYLNEQQQIMSAVISKDEMVYERTFFIGDSVHTHDITNCLRNAHHVLISALASYFERTYKVSLETDEIEKALLPKEPDRYSYNTSEYKEYYSALEALELKYEDILDQIFIQLGGFSFQEKALNELKQKAHDAAWNRYYGNKSYEQKKAVVSFSYGCSFDSWHEEYHHGEHEIQLNEGMKNIIRAMAYFEYGNAETTNYSIDRLLSYSWDTYNTEMTLGMEKVKSVKCFKNCRVDIRFTSEAYAREFVETFLGTEL